MKVLILVPIWGRPSITRIWAEGMKNFLKNETVLTILSPEDAFLAENEQIIRKYGFRMCYFPNKPLGKKLNAGIEFALSNYKFDYMMNLGSDDLIHPKIFDLYEPLIEQNCCFLGLDKIYFFNILLKQLALSKVYLWGAGRMIHREVLIKIQNKDDFLYKHEYERGLDCNSVEKISFLLNIRYKQAETNDFPYLVDLKSQEGINDFHLMSRFYDLVDSEILKQHFPKTLMDLIYE